MTIKELAEFTGKNKSTIGRWIEKLDEVEMINELQNATSSNPVDFTIDEVERILKAGSMSKDAVTILMNNARQSKELTVNNTNNSVDYVEIGKMIAMAVTSAMTPILKELRQPQQNQPKQLALPEAPQKEPRAYLNQLVREYSVLKSVDFRIGWNVLYSEILSRCHENIKVKAKNEGIKPIDYLERENKLLTACSIMKELIK